MMPLSNFVIWNPINNGFKLYEGLDQRKCSGRVKHLRGTSKSQKGSRKVDKVKRKTEEGELGSSVV